VRKFSSYELQTKRSARRAPREPVIVSQLRHRKRQPLPEADYTCRSPPLTASLIFMSNRWTQFAHTTHEG
jgi:hypothetical protein